jgi:hypothetical protein
MQEQYAALQGFLLDWGILYMSGFFKLVPELRWWIRVSLIGLDADLWPLSSLAT